MQSLFDFLPDEQAQKYKQMPSTDWKWKMKDDYPKQTNGLKVFSCFACGGGSTMGYKLAGCDVIGCCEIDKRMNVAYVRNHNPKYNFLMDIRDFNKSEDLPEELYDLDILDGSPPRTTFTAADPWRYYHGKGDDFMNENKQKQIEEMAMFLYNQQKWCDVTNPYEVAQLLYNAGYRKIPEGAVVLTKKEYDELQRQVDELEARYLEESKERCEYEQKYKKIQHVHNIGLGAQRSQWEKKVRQAVKDTEEKVIKAALTEVLGYCADDEVGMKYLIKRTAKKYGVEL